LAWALRFIPRLLRGAVIEKAALKLGFTLSTARWIEELAKELGVKEKRLLKAIVKLAKHGIWLEAEDWRLAARHLDLSRHLDMAVDYVIRRVAAGASPAEAVKELPKAVEKAGKLSHIREVLDNLT
jgi:DNA-binding Lrp family transcriptional regulator